MYEKLDSFIDTETWRSTHPRDEQRFFMVLHELLKNRDFDTEQMADYMRQKAGTADNHAHPLTPAIDHYTAAAWAVEGYVEAYNL